MLDVSGDCGQPEVPPHTAGRIVNGEEATPHSFPWMVVIYINIYLFVKLWLSYYYLLLFISNINIFKKINFFII